MSGVEGGSEGGPPPSADCRRGGKDVMVRRGLLKGRSAGVTGFVKLGVLFCIKLCRRPS